VIFEKLFFTPSTFSECFGSANRLKNVCDVFCSFTAQFLPGKTKGWNLRFQLQLVEKASRFETSRNTEEVPLEFPDISDFCQLYKHQKHEVQPKKGLLERALGKFGWF
jgi:hypothetical protein